MQQKKVLQSVTGLILALAMILVILITSFQYAAYGDYSFYRKEYDKYDVYSEVHMEPKEVMKVTRTMMKYLIGKKKELSITTVVDWKVQDFFNEQDRLHMADVKNLFLGGLFLRRCCLVLMAICLGLLIRWKVDLKECLTRSWFQAVSVFFLILLVLGFLISRDFTAVFTKFHELFFNNDLWLLDPETDYMIRILPEGFFLDMTLRIGKIFGAALLVVSAICGLARKISIDYK